MKTITAASSTTSAPVVEPISIPLPTGGHQTNATGEGVPAIEAVPEPGGTAMANALRALGSESARDSLDQLYAPPASPQRAIYEALRSGSSYRARANVLDTLREAMTNRASGSLVTALAPAVEESIRQALAPTPSPSTVSALMVAFPSMPPDMRAAWLTEWLSCPVLPDGVEEKALALIHGGELSDAARQNLMVKLTVRGLFHRAPNPPVNAQLP